MKARVYFVNPNTNNDWYVSILQGNLPDPTIYRLVAEVDFPTREEVYQALQNEDGPWAEANNPSILRIYIADRSMWYGDKIEWEDGTIDVYALDTRSGWKTYLPQTK